MFQLFTSDILTLSNLSIIFWFKAGFRNEGWACLDPLVFLPQPPECQGNQREPPHWDASLLCCFSLPPFISVPSTSPLLHLCRGPQSLPLPHDFNHHFFHNLPIPHTRCVWASHQLVHQGSCSGLTYSIDSKTYSRFARPMGPSLPRNQKHQCLRLYLTPFSLLPSPKSALNRTNLSDLMSDKSPSVCPLSCYPLSGRLSLLLLLVCCLALSSVIPLFVIHPSHYCYSLVSERDTQAA